MNIKKAVLLATFCSTLSFLYPHLYFFAANIPSMASSNVGPNITLGAFGDFSFSLAFAVFFIFLSAEFLGYISPEWRRKAAAVAAVLVGLQTVYLFWEMHYAVALHSELSLVSTPHAIAYLLSNAVVSVSWTLLFLVFALRENPFLSHVTGKLALLIATFVVINEVWHYGWHWYSISLSHQTLAVMALQTAIRLCSRIALLIFLFAAWRNRPSVALERNSPVTA